MSVSVAWRVKDPADIRPFEFDWQDEVPSGDTVTGSTWAVTPNGLTLGATSIPEARITRVIISGGTDGAMYEVTNTVDTANGRHFERTFGIRVRNL